MIKRDLTSLKETDIYSFVLFALYNLKEVPEYSTLSELAYVLDRKNLFKLLDYFGGVTIKIPTRAELQIIINALLIYQCVNIEKMSMATALNRLDKIDSIQLKEIVNTYNKLCEKMGDFIINEKQ